MLQKRFLFSSLIVFCLLVACVAFLPATASAATLAGSSKSTSFKNSGALMPATSIHRVSDQDCATRTDFFKLWNNTTIANGVCFASDGGLDVEIDNVYQITPGNNVGFVIDRIGQKIWICKPLLRIIAHVTFVEITGRAGAPCPA
jgi:hypothetical protein